LVDGGVAVGVGVGVAVGVGVDVVVALGVTIAVTPDVRDRDWVRTTITGFFSLMEHMYPSSTSLASCVFRPSSPVLGRVLTLTPRVAGPG
jgi:hypothetical protein